MVASGLRRLRGRSRVVMGGEFQFGKMKMFRRRRVVRVAQQVNMLIATVNLRRAEGLVVGRIYSGGLKGQVASPLKG